MTRHLGTHAKATAVDLGWRRDWESRRLLKRGLWCDPAPYVVQHDTADRFTGPVAEVIYEYCCMRFMAGQRVPEEFDIIGLRAYNEVFRYGRCTAPELTKPAQPWEEAKVEIT